METLISLAILVVGTILLAAVFLKTTLHLFQLEIWSVALPSKILVVLLSGVFSLFFTIIAPILFIAVIVGIEITLPLLFFFALPCLLIGLGSCLIITCFY